MPPRAISPAAVEAPSHARLNGIAAAAAAEKISSPAAFSAVTVSSGTNCNLQPGGTAAAATARSAVSPATTETPRAAVNTPIVNVSNFRAPKGCEGEFLPRAEKTPCPIHAEEKTNGFPPSQGNDGCRSLETAATEGALLKDQAQQNVAGSRVAAAPFKTPTRTSTTRRPLKEVIAFGGIHQEFSSPVRSSERVKMQKNGDATQMERAVMRTEQRLYAISPGTKSKLSFSALPHSEIGARANKLGISLGANESEINESISLLKRCEEDRRITYLQNNLNSCTDAKPDSNILATASSLCSDLVLEDQIEPMDNLPDPSLVMPIKCLKKQKKKMDTKLGVVVRRSTRISKNKNLKLKK
jgi:hypothetical protein